MIPRFSATLRLVHASAGDNFSGVGVIISDAPGSIPIFPIRSCDRPFGNAELVEFLAEISTKQSEYHDGFHVISSDWKLLRVAQYFSPPIIGTLPIDRSKRFGGRYLAALFGSALDGIQAIGIASADFGVAIFQNGEEVFYERAS